MTGEDRLIAWLRRRAGGRGGKLLGDDAAVLPRGGDAVVSVDQQIAGVHFPVGLAPQLVARRLVAIGLSDLAAMGAEPRFAFLALATPPGFAHRAFFDALLAACDRFGLTLAGGDLARGAEVAAALTVTGRRTARGRFVGRDGARPGDAIWLGGSVGESAAGRSLLAAGARPTARGVHLPRRFPRSAPLRRAARRAVRRHLEPTPQLDLGAWLARRRRAAAIDVSDGLALDLHRLCRAGGVGARLDAARLPLAPRFAELVAALGGAPLELALGGGEDYVLLAALPPRVAPPPAFAARRIGEIVAPRRLTLELDGSRRPLAAAGWDHLRSL